MTNYLGHGGSKGWSQERVLKVTDIQNYTNYDKLTTFVTATCSFTGYDDPALVTAGELCLSNPSGAAVALLTTTRAVYITGNKRLTAAVYDTMFTKEDNSYMRLGEIMRRAKKKEKCQRDREREERGEIVREEIERERREEREEREREEREIYRLALAAGED